jgi:hypothetical protein
MDCLSTKQVLQRKKVLQNEKQAFESLLVGLEVSTPTRDHMLNLFRYCGFDISFASRCYASNWDHSDTGNRIDTKTESTKKTGGMTWVTPSVFLKFDRY